MPCRTQGPCASPRSGSIRSRGCVGSLRALLPIVEPWGLGRRPTLHGGGPVRALPAHAARAAPHGGDRGGSRRPAASNSAAPWPGRVASCGSRTQEAPDRRRSSIFRDTAVPARGMRADEAAAWLSAALGLALPAGPHGEPATARPVDPDFAEPDDRVSFADGFPLLLTNDAPRWPISTRACRRPSAWTASAPTSRSRVRGGLGRGRLGACSSHRRGDASPAQGLRALRRADGRSGYGHEVRRTTSRCARSRASAARPAAASSSARTSFPRGLGRIAVGDPTSRTRLNRRVPKRIRSARSSRRHWRRADDRNSAPNHPATSRGTTPKRLRCRACAAPSSSARPARTDRARASLQARPGLAVEAEPVGGREPPPVRRRVEPRAADSRSRTSPARAGRRGRAPAPRPRPAACRSA